MPKYVRIERKLSLYAYLTLAKDYYILQLSFMRSWYRSILSSLPHVHVKINHLGISSTFIHQSPCPVQISILVPPPLLSRALSLSRYLSLKLLQLHLFLISTGVAAWNVAMFLKMSYYTINTYFTQHYLKLAKVERHTAVQHCVLDRGTRLFQMTFNGFVHIWKGGYMKDSSVLENEFEMLVIFFCLWYQGAEKI